VTFSPTGPSPVARSREKADSEKLDLIALEAQEILELNASNPKKPVPESDKHKDSAFHAYSHRKRNIFLGVAILILAISTPAYADKATTGDNIARGVSIDGIDVGNMSSAKAEEILEPKASRAIETPLTFQLGDDKVLISSQDLTLSYDVGKTVKNAHDINRTYNPLEVIPSFFARTFSDKEASLVSNYNKDQFETSINNLVNHFSKGRVDAGVVIEGTNVKVIRPQSGDGVSHEQIESALKSAINTFGREPIELKEEKVEAQISLEEAQNTAETLKTMFSRDSVLTTPSGNKVNITKEQLAASVVITPKNRDLVITIDEAKLRTALVDQLSAIEVAPQDASFDVSGNSVNVIPSISGKQIDFKQATKEWIAGKHQFNVKIANVEPTRNTEWAKSLNITEPVASFTTNFPAGQERVKNIRRASEVVSGTVLEPGQKFSLNEALGPRTAASGYVQAPAFAVDKGFYEDFGGGVSQYSTTLFNAFYMGGYEHIAHKPHTIYISRYPKGREATLNYGSVDMSFRNDSNSGVLIRSSVGSTSVTVVIYGNKEGRTVTMEGPNELSRTEYTTEYVDDPTMPAGKEKQLEAGYPGIVVENIRIIEKPGAEPKRERYRWSYKMIPRKVARGTQQPSTTPSVPVS